MRWLRGGLRVLAAFSTGLLALSFLGDVHPVGDSLAVARLPLGACVLVSAWGFDRRARLALSALALAAQGPMLSARLAPQEAAGQYTHYQKNLWAPLADADAVLADIAASGAQSVSLQEVSRRNLAAVYDPLTDRYPAHAFCAFSGIGGVAVLSVWPALGPPICDGGPEDGMVALLVDHPDGPLWLVSVHLHWPWPHSQPAQLERLLPRLSELDGRVLIGGDLNMVRWSSVVRRLERVTATRTTGHAPISFYLMGQPAVQLAIDHVLVPVGSSGALEARPYLGSDHKGLVARWE